MFFEAIILYGEIRPQYSARILLFSLNGNSLQHVSSIALG